MCHAEDGALETQPMHVGMDRFADESPEQPVEVKGREAGEPCQAHERERLGQVLADVVDDAVHPVAVDVGEAAGRHRGGLHSTEEPAARRARVAAPRRRGARQRSFSTRERRLAGPRRTAHPCDVITETDSCASPRRP
jgi:hypothetical protein